MIRNWQVPNVGRIRFRLCGWSTVLSAVCVLALSTLMFAAPPPLWWSARGATSTQPTNDSAAINQGQLKQFTQKAVDEMNARFPGGAGTELNAIIQGWEEDYATNGYSPTNPNPADFHAITIGQLKWVAQKIHARLFHFRWQDELPLWLVLNPATDNQLANIGQLKTVFAFDLTAPDGELPLWWQKYYFNTTGLDPNGIPSGGTTSYLDHYVNGTAPTTGAESPDPDGDGLTRFDDAVENDSNISWQRTKDFRYLWMPVTAPAGYRAVDVNDRGQILFEHYQFTEQDRIDTTDHNDWLSRLPTTPVGKIWDPSLSGTHAWKDIFFTPAPFQLRMFRLLVTKIFDNPHSADTYEATADGLSTQDVELPMSTDIMSSYWWSIRRLSVRHLGNDGSVTCNVTMAYFTSDDDPEVEELAYYAYNADLANGYVFMWKPGSYNGCELVGGNDRGYVDLYTGTGNHSAGFYTGPNGANRFAMYDQIHDPFQDPEVAEDTTLRDTFLKSYELLENGQLGSSASSLGVADRENDYESYETPQRFTRSGRALIPNLLDFNTTEFYLSGDPTPINGADENTTLTDLPGGGLAIGGPNDPLRTLKNGSFQATTVSGVTEVDAFGTGIGNGTAGKAIWRNGQWITLQNATGGVALPAGVVPRRITSRGVIWAGNDSGQNGILIPLAVVDNLAEIDGLPYTGVDDESIKAEPAALGYQNKFWIMAPAGGANYNNLASVESTSGVQANLEIESDNALLDPSTIPLDGETGPLSLTTNVLWSGKAVTGDSFPSYTLGITPLQGRPIGVLAMKKRTVKVVVQPVAKNYWVFSPDVPVPTKAALEAKLNRIYGHQINAWFDVTIKPEIEADYDPNNDGRIIVGTAEESALGALGDAPGDVYDIKIILTSEVLLGLQTADPNHPLPIKGVCLPVKNTCLVSSGTPDQPNIDLGDVIFTIAHEIGHVLLGSGHPDQGTGPAPLSKNGTDSTKRLMFSGPTLSFDNFLLVKTEWEEANSWLSKRKRGDL